MNDSDNLSVTEIVSNHLRANKIKMKRKYFLFIFNKTMVLTSINATAENRRREGEQRKKRREEKGKEEERWKQADLVREASRAHA